MSVLNFPISNSAHAFGSAVDLPQAPSVTGTGTGIGAGTGVHGVVEVAEGNIVLGFEFLDCF